MKSKIEYLTSGIVINDSNREDELNSFAKLIMSNESDPFTFYFIVQTVNLIKTNLLNLITKKDIQRISSNFIFTGVLPPLCMPLIFNFLCQHLDQKELALAAIDNVVSYIRRSSTLISIEKLELFNQTLNNPFFLEAFQAIHSPNGDSLGFEGRMAKIKIQMNTLMESHKIRTDEELNNHLLELPKEVIKQVILPYNDPFQPSPLPQPFEELGRYLLAQLKTTLQNINDASLIMFNNNPSCSPESPGQVVIKDRLPKPKCESFSESFSIPSSSSLSSSSSSFFSSAADYTKEEQIGFNLIARLVREQFPDITFFTQLEPANKASTTGACIQIVFINRQQGVANNAMNTFIRDNNIRILASGGGSSSGATGRYYLTFTREDANTLAKTIAARIESNTVSIV